MSTTPEPLTVSLTIGLDTPVDVKYRQVGEDEWTESPITVLDAVIERAAAMLAQKATSDRGDGSLSRDLRDRVLRRIDAVVSEKVGPIIDEALAGEIRPTNAFGEPTGKPVTLRELVIAQVGKELLKPSGRDSFAPKTALQEAVATVAKNVVAKELAEPIAAAKAEITGLLRDSVSEVLAEAVVKGITR